MQFYKTTRNVFWWGYDRRMILSWSRVWPLPWWLGLWSTLYSSPGDYQLIQQRAVYTTSLLAKSGFGEMAEDGDGADWPCEGAAEVTMTATANSLPFPHQRASCGRSALITVVSCSLTAHEQRRVRACVRRRARTTVGRSVDQWLVFGRSHGCSFSLLTGVARATGGFDEHEISPSVAGFGSFWKLQD